MRIIYQSKAFLRLVVNPEFAVQYPSRNRLQLLIQYSIHGCEEQLSRLAVAESVDFTKRYSIHEVPDYIRYDELQIIQMTMDKEFWIQFLIVNSSAISLY